MTTITIAPLDRPEACGDWHDKPLRYVVTGPGTERQKFSTLKEAESYSRIRRRSPNLEEATREYVRHVLRR